MRRRNFQIDHFDDPLNNPSLGAQIKCLTKCLNKKFLNWFLGFAQSFIRSKILAKVRPAVTFFQCENYEMNFFPMNFCQDLEFATIDITNREILKFSLTRPTDLHACTPSISVKSKKFILFDNLLLTQFFFWHKGPKLWNTYSNS